MNRIRNAYLELAPGLEPYFVTSRHDDPDGVLLSSLAMRRPLPVLQPSFSIPGVVAVVDSVVAGAIVGIAALGLDLGTGWSLALGGSAFAVSLAAFVLWAEHEIARHTARLVVRFPEPGADQPTS